VTLASFATVVQTQGRVQGVLLDSLRAMGPLADAEVVLLPGGRRTRTDESGAFLFDEVSPGTYRVSYAPLWLDSIGVAPISVETSVSGRERERLVLLTGSRVAMARDRCGGTMDADRGLVVGEVRDARGQPLPGVVAVARWSETHVGRGAPTAPQEYIALDTTRSDARFALCGMLAGAEVVVAATHPDGRSTGAIVLTVTPGVFARDLLLGDPARSVRVWGIVANAEGAPIPRAEVLASHATSGIARSDSAGRFELAVLDGSRQLVVRALGFQPRVLDVRIPEDGLDLEAITLEPVETVLDTFVIRARAQTREQAEFDYRRRTLNGVFLDESILERFPAVTPSAIVSQSRSWVRVFRPNPRGVGEVRIFQGYSATGGEILCRPRLFVDGRDWGDRTDATEVNAMLAMAKRVEIFRASFAPPQFADFGGCGALVIWTH
jgi:hypothetical protein